MREQMYNYVEISVHEVGQTMLARVRIKHEGKNLTRVMKSEGRVKIFETIITKDQTGNIKYEAAKAQARKMIIKTIKSGKRNALKCEII